MKIDPKIQLPPDGQPDQVRPSRNSNAAYRGGANTSVISSSSGEDTVSISSTHSELQSLTANLANVPDVRIDRVSALQPQVSRGAYQPDSAKIADALIADQSRRGLQL
jgi:flagellar biosynthesis anti-sigma factor FlgM